MSKFLFFGKKLLLLRNNLTKSHNYMKKTSLLFVFALCRALGFAQNPSTIMLTNDNDILTIGKQVYYLEDVEGKITIEEIVKTENQSKFKKNETDVINFGNTLSTFWFRIEIDSRQVPQTYLEIGNSMLDNVWFFAPQNGKYAVRKAGASLPKSVKEVDVNSILFALPVQPDSVLKQTYYLKIRSNYPIEVPIGVANLRPLMERQSGKNIAFSLYMGLMISMALYNLFVYFLVRDKVYIIYSLFTFMIALFYLHLKGYMFHLVWGNMPYLNSYTPSYSAFVTILMALFANSFLNTRKYTPYFYKGSYFFYALFVFCIVLNISGDYLISANLSQLGAMLVAIYILITALRAWWAGSPMAKFYLIAWSIYLSSVVIFILQVTSAISSNVFTNHSVFLGTAMEVLLLSFALAYRINLLKKEKEEAQSQNLRLVSEQNKILEEKIQEKTKDLVKKNEEIQVAYEEVAQVNKELQQTQKELLSQRDLLAEQNDTLELFKTQITSSIRSAQTIQQAILPPKAKLDEILGEYFILNRPKDQVSGDFYWANQIGAKKFLVVADCTGHGVSGAFMTMIGNTLLDKIIKVWHIYNPAQILETVHQEIRDVLQQNETGSKEGMDIVVAVLEESENPAGFKVEFAGAKRPMYYIEAGKSEVQKLLGVRKMVGGFTNENKKYVGEEKVLPKNSLIYMASDGYADQNDLSRHSFSEKRFMGLLSIIQENPLPEQKAFLEEAIETHMTGTEQRDDILVLGLRV